MPYDPRPVSQGGNRQAGEVFDFAAPSGKFRIIGVDTFDGGDFLVGDFDSQELAIEHAEERVKGKQMLKMHVYNDQGENVFDCGEF